MDTDHLETIVRRRVRASLAAQERLLDGDVPVRVAAVGRAMVDAFRAGHKVIALGNGGSAAQAQHLVAELVGRFDRDRRPLPAITLADNGASMTAIANDYSFDEVFARQVRGLATPGDVVVGLSTSGDSANVVGALRAAVEMGAGTVALTGMRGGHAAKAVEHCLRFPADDTALIQEGHEVFIHSLCEIVERSMFGGL